MSHSTYQTVKVCVIALMIIFSIGGARAQPTGIRAIDTYIAKSTFINLADADNATLQPQGYSYLPAGTRFIAFNKTTDYLGVKRRLILTESGIWGYIRDSDDYYWAPKRYDIFLNNKTVVIIKERRQVKYALSPEVSLVIWFTPSEAYPLVKEGEEKLKLKVDKTKVAAIGDEVFYEIDVPRDIATIINTEEIEIARDDINFFYRSVFENVVGVQKPCGSEEVTTIKKGGGAGIKLENWFGWLKIGAEAEKKRFEEIGAKFNVTRWYYTRKGKIELHRVTKKQDCDSGKLNYSYLNPRNVEIEFRQGREDQEDFAFEAATGRLLVTCGRQYFALARYLKAFEFEEYEIEFLISRLARFKDTHNSARCL